MSCCGKPKAESPDHRSNASHSQAGTSSSPASRPALRSALKKSALTPYLPSGSRITQPSNPELDELITNANSAFNAIGKSSEIYSLSLEIIRDYQKTDAGSNFLNRTDIKNITFEEPSYTSKGILTKNGIAAMNAVISIANRILKERINNLDPTEKTKERLQSMKNIPTDLMIETLSEKASQAALNDKSLSDDDKIERLSPLMNTVLNTKIMEFLKEFRKDCEDPDLSEADAERYENLYDTISKSDDAILQKIIFHDPETYKIFSDPKIPYYFKALEISEKIPSNQ